MQFPSSTVHVECPRDLSVQKYPQCRFKNAVIHQSQVGELVAHDNKNTSLVGKLFFKE